MGKAQGCNSGLEVVVSQVLAGCLPGGGGATALSATDFKVAERQ